MEEILNKKNYILLIAIIFVAVSLSGTTYSLFIKVDDTNQFNYKTGILDLEFQEENIIEFKSFKERRLRIYAFNDECPDDTNDHCYSACLNEF